MKRPSSSSILATVGIGASLILLLASNLPILRLMLSFSLVLLLPGYAMTVILFPRDRVGIPERLLLSIGLSVAITALTGLVLHWTPWGIQTTSLWVVLLLWVGVEVAVIILVRRPEWSEVITVPVLPDFHWRQWVLLVLAAVVVITAMHVARAPAPQQGLEGYTVLWIQPADTPDRVRLGVNSEEFATTKYQLLIEVNDVIREGPTFELEPGESWEGFLRLPDQRLEDEPLTVLLYRLDNPAEVYRRVVWWPETS